jgi:hypothetical protein
MTNLSLGSGVREIGTGAFFNHSLTELIIPAQVVQISASFRYSNPANTLQSIIIEGDSERFSDIWDAIFPAYLNPTS